MSGTGPAHDSQPARRSFAAQTRNTGWGLGLSIFGALCLLSAVYALTAWIGGEDASNPLPVVVVGGACLAVGIYLLRGTSAPSSARPAQYSVNPQSDAAVPAASIEAASAALAAAPAGGAALVAYRNLDATVRRDAPQNAQAVLDAELARIDFDASTISSERLGYVGSLAGGSVEIFRDYVVHGQEAHTVEPTTRGTVYTDGAIQTHTTVRDHDGRKKVSHQQHDLRTAQLQLASAGWALSTPISPDAVNDARLLISQLAIHVESLAGKPLTRADIREMVDSIQNDTRQPAADRIRQLDALRYERLLSDDEFAQAKDRILDL